MVIYIVRRNILQYAGKSRPLSSLEENHESRINRPAYSVVHLHVNHIRVCVCACNGKDCVCFYLWGWWLWRGIVSLHNDIMALTEAGEDARGLRAELFSLVQVCECVCVSVPGLQETSWALWTKVKLSKTKTKPDQQQYEAEGRPFGCCPLAGACVWRAEGRHVWGGRKQQRKREGGPGSCRRGSRVNSACRPGRF